MKPPPSGRPAGGGWRRRLPSAGVASKALALAATLGFVTLVGVRAGPAAPRPAPAPAASAPPDAPAAATLAAAAGPAPGAGAPAAPAASAPGAGGAGGAPAAGVLPDGRVVLNVASEEELTRLPGIGPARAKAIAALRARVGRFRSLNDLRRVKGIGRRSLERLRPHAVLDAPAPA